MERIFMAKKERKKLNWYTGENTWILKIEKYGEALTNGSFAREF